jgi:hypothetical protein
MLGQSYIYIDPVFTCKSTGEKHITEEDACPIINECEIRKFNLSLVYP